MAEAFGRVRERRDGRIYLDFGRYGKVYSAKGAPFQNQTQARHVLSAIRTLVASGTPKQRAIDRWLPASAAAHRVLAVPASPSMRIRGRTVNTS